MGSLNCTSLHTFFLSGSKSRVCVASLPNPIFWIKLTLALYSNNEDAHKQERKLIIPESLIRFYTSKSAHRKIAY